MKEIGQLDSGLLIEVPDAPFHQKLDQLEKKFFDILANCSGSVAISPPYDQVDALTKLCTAVYQACKTNPLFSVSFAVTDKKIQENLISAASNILISRIDERELDIDDGDEDEDDLESLSLDWKSP